MSLISKFLFLLLLSSSAIAKEIKIDDCYNQQGSDFVLECFNEKVETESKKYESLRHYFIKRTVGEIENGQEFVKDERSVNKRWLDFINRDCKMYALSTGEKASRVYNVGYSECILNKYRERENYFSEQ